MKMRKFLLLICLMECCTMMYAQQMDALWGKQEVKSDKSPYESESLKQFRDGNYALFVHWGLYSAFAGEWKGTTYYGIGEWLMSQPCANIPVDEYKSRAKDFNPVAFDAKALVKLAKDAGMKYIIITSKHHDGFAMYHSHCDSFNIVDATPFARDPMEEISKECKKQGIGFGFYYSQTQDWTTPGGHSGPATDVNGKPKSFEDYFREKCLPQLKEICTRYGDINVIWFDTPANITREHVQQLIDTVRKYQPEALVSGRVGYDMGDYVTLGDMEMPTKNMTGLWEAIDVTNDSWGYVWYDQNWKSPKEVLTRLLSTVARGGTYLLNVGPKPDGSLPEQAAFSLRKAGEWIHKYPQVVYGGAPSPWGKAMPWGDVVCNGDKLYLLIYDWPADNDLQLYGLSDDIRTASLLDGKNKKKLKFASQNGWTTLNLPLFPAETYVNVVELQFKQKPQIDQSLFLSPDGVSVFGVDLADNIGNEKSGKSWMEKFGEWKHVTQVNKWGEGSESVWEVQVKNPGYYQVELNYSGQGRVTWRIQSGNGRIVQNQQAALPAYMYKPMGWMYFEKPGKYNIAVSILEGDKTNTSLQSIRFTAVK